MIYTDYESFENKIFWEELFYELSIATFKENSNGFKEFIDICQKTLNHHAIHEQNPFKSCNA